MAFLQGCINQLAAFIGGGSIVRRKLRLRVDPVVATKIGLSTHHDIKTNNL